MGVVGVRVGLQWRRAWEKRCPWYGGDRHDWGRCELRRGHEGDCALQRGTHVFRFARPRPSTYRSAGKRS